MMKNQEMGNASSARYLLIFLLESSHTGPGGEEQVQQAWRCADGAVVAAEQFLASDKISSH